jgi:hypothetical protein
MTVNSKETLHWFKLQIFQAMRTILTTILLLDLANIFNLEVGDQVQKEIS